MMTCDRAVAVLRGLETNQLAADAKEVDEVLKCALAVEADPDTFFALERIMAVRTASPALEASPLDAQCLSAALAEIERKLKDELHRFTTGKDKIRAEEEVRIRLRYALGQVNDPVMGANLNKMMVDRAQVADGATYVACPSLGVELYAITHRGRLARQELEHRLARFAQVPLAAFLKSFDKTDAKMQGFVNELATLSAQVPHVRKHRAQVIVGLVKSGLPTPQAVGTYREAVGKNYAPDVAVTCARNAAKFGSAAGTIDALTRARWALLQAGLPDTPLLSAVAKSLLGFDPPEAGASRFVELVRGLEQMLPRAVPPDVYKLAARLMPAAGTAPEVLRRAYVAAQNVAAHPQSGPDAIQQGKPKIAVALASMVKAEDVLAALVARFFQLQTMLLEEAQGNSAAAADYALECVACPGHRTKSLRSCAISPAGSVTRMSKPATIATVFPSRSPLRSVSHTDARSYFWVMLPFASMAQSPWRSMGSSSKESFLFTLVL